MSDHPTDTQPAPAIAADLFCPSCAYNLRGLTGSRCPECGELIEDLRDPVSRIPWVHRTKIGWWRAYWKTVYFVMFKQKHFANEMARPVSYRDAQVFRWVTVALAFLPFPLLGFVSARAHTGFSMDGWLVLNLSTSEFQGWIYILSILLSLVAATGIPGYFFHPRELSVEQQNRAIALSCYECAPLAWSAIPVGNFLAPLVVRDPADELRPVLWLVSSTVAVALLACWWLNLLRLARATGQRPRIHATWVGVTIPLLWGVISVGTLIGIPLIAVFLVVLIRSFTT